VQQLHQDQRVLIETGHHRISGSLRMPVDGFRSRLTDYLNAPDLEFIPLTDVVVERIGGGDDLRAPFMAVARRHVVLARPLDDEVAKAT